MCDICKKWSCPPSCPNHSEGNALRCGSCGSRLSEGDGYYEKDGKPYCEECVQAATAEELIRICETEELDFFEAIGLRHVYL